MEALVGEMTLRELSTKSKKSVDAIVAWALGGRTSSPGRIRVGNGSGRKSSTANGSPEGKTVNTRTAKGRERYEQAVLETVKQASGPMSAQEIRSKVGGTPLQARTVLNRLIEGRKLEFEGRARATRYFAR